MSLYRVDIRHEIDPLTQVHTWGYTKAVPYPGPLGAGLYYLPPMINTRPKFSTVFSIIADNPTVMKETAREVIKRQQMAFEFIKSQMKMPPSEIRIDQDQKELT